VPDKLVLVNLPSPKSSLKLLYEPVISTLYVAIVPVTGLIDVIAKKKVTSGHVKSSKITSSSDKFLILQSNVV
jgi:hypothetical protein